ncbi:MAG: hypothetical protein KA369_01960 [Spirochaetes bacterium]|nr:hypothetical protein [Spirochaetota bacterium]
MTDPAHFLVKTGDGSYTLYLPEYDEHMHSLSGAYEEALLKHVRPSGILGLNKSALQVLDVGFGLGYNTLALLAELERAGYLGVVTVFSLERDRSLAAALASITFDDDRGRLYTALQKAYIGGSSTAGSASISVLFGDARENVRPLPDEAFDAVFFDPFSPSRNPELWSVDFFRQIYRTMNDQAVLTTYSSAPQVRSALLEAGFLIGRGPSVGGKREGTIASKSNIIPEITAHDMALLMANKRAVPYRDPELSADRETIRGRRSDEMKQFHSEINDQ